MNALLHLALLLSPLADPRTPVLVIGNGCGVIVDARGYAVTCLHVVAGSKGGAAATLDGRVHLLHVLARDEEAELALVWLDAPGYTFVPARLAETPARLLDRVTVIGHPRDFRWTVTTGKVTAVGRTITYAGDRELRGLLQCDASINPGNSGGAVLDAQGRLAGLPVALREGAMNIGFVIPAAQVRRFLDTHLPK